MPGQTQTFCITAYSQVTVMLLFFILGLFGIQATVWTQCATQLTVLTQPEALVSSSGNVVEGSVIQIYCTVEMDTTVTFIWTFNGSPLLSDPPHIRIREDNRPERSLSLITDDSTSVLTVDNFRDTDNGVYQCTAADGSGNNGNGTAVTLRSVPSNPSGTLRLIIQPSDNEVPAFNQPALSNLNDNRTGIRIGGHFPVSLLACTAGHQGDGVMNYSPPSVVWVRNGQVVVSGSRITTASTANGQVTTTLELPNFQETDAGVYQCVFTDDSGSGEVITTIPHRADTGNTLRLERVSPEVIILRPPEKLVIELRVSGDYEVLRWYKGVVGNDIPRRVLPKEFPSYFEMFVRDKTTADDEGVYIIQTELKTQFSQTMIPSGGIDFAVIPPDDATTTLLSPDTVIIPEGGSANISCRSVGVPVPTISWELNNHTVGFEQTDTETPFVATLTGDAGNKMVDLTPGNIESTLHIVNAMYPDHDGVYTCIGTNADDPSVASSSAQISVRINVIPELSFERDLYRFQAGTSPTITCIVVARALGTFAELVEVIDGVENVRATSEGDTILTLEHTILNIQLNRHNSMFICRAANDIGGAVSIATNITVFNAPDMINHTLIDTTIISLVAARVVFTPPNDNNSPIARYQYQLCQDTCNNACSYTSAGQITPAPDNTGPGMDTTSERLSFTVNGLVPGSDYILRVTAVNFGGNGTVPVNDNDAHRFPAATLEQAAAVDGFVDQRLQTQLVFTWDLPSLARGPGTILPNMFVVTWMRSGASVTDNIAERIPFGDTIPNQGILLSNLITGTEYIVSVVTNYTEPNIESSALVIAGTTLQAGEEPVPAVNIGPVALTNTPTLLTIGWLSPNVNFLTTYIVSYTTESTFKTGRRKRQSTPIVERVPVDTNTLTINGPEPAARYTFNVDGEVLPPGATQPAVIPITPEQVIMSSDHKPNAPTITSVRESSNGDPFHCLDITWDLPSMAGGILRRCTLVMDSRHIILPSLGDMAPTSFTVCSLSPGRDHPFDLFCSNRLDGMIASGSGRTAIGVEIPGLSISNVENNEITVQLIARSTIGPISSYQIIISTSPFTGDTLDQTFQAYPGHGSGYVTYTGTIPPRSLYVTSVVIGNGEVTASNGLSFINQPLQPGEYYVFARVFGQEINLFNDSLVIGPISTDPCEGFECPSSATCELFENMPGIMEAYCVPSCDLDNGGCRGDEICTLVPQDPLECLQLDAPCPPTVTCSPRDTCATVRCRNGYVCKVHSPTGKAFCELSCDLNNGGCSPGTHCIVRDDIECTDGPCPPLRSCCPHPRCDMNLCAARRTRRALCTNPFISESCEGGSNECPVTFCHVCYFSESDRSVPGECGDSCSNYTTSNSCSRRWATCIRRAHLHAYGQAWPRRRNRIEGDFRCYNSPCAQN